MFISPSVNQKETDAGLDLETYHCLTLRLLLPFDFSLRQQARGLTLEYTD